MPQAKATRSSNDTNSAANFAKENLQSFLERANFSFSLLKPRSHRASASSLSTPSFGAAHSSFTRLTNTRLSSGANGRHSLALVLPHTVDTERVQDPKAAVEAKPTATSITDPHPSGGAVQVQAELAHSTAKVTSPGNDDSSTSSGSTVSRDAPEPKSYPVGTKHLLPVTHISQTLRASSLGATMAPPVSSYEEAKMYGLHWSRFRAGGNAEGEPGSFDVNKMTNDALARQESISRRVMVLRNKRSASAEEDRKSTKSEGSDPDSKLRRAKEEAQHWESERQQAKQREQERTAAELLEKERLKQEHRDQERIKQERLEHERLEHERLEQERRELDRLEQQRIEQLRLEQERREKARLEEERLEQERLQQERLDQERRDQALREEKEHLEQERLEQERLEQERREKERREQERLEQERLEQERHEEQERLEQQRLELKRREEEMERELARLKTQIQGQLLEKHKKLISEVDTTEREALQKAQDQQDIVEKEITDISARRNELGSQQHSKELEIGNKKLEIEELTKVLEEAKEALERLQHEAASIENSKARIEEERTEAQELLLAIHAEQNIISEQATGERSRLEKAFAKESSSVDDLAKEAASRTVNPSQDTKSVEPSNGTKPGVNKPADDKFDVDKFDVDKFDADKSDINKTPDAVPAEIEDLTHQDFFKAWPKSESRPFGAAPKRLVKLTNLPSTSTLISIQALVWGGRIEKLAYLPGSTSAWALFMRGEDSERYLKDTANGIDAPGEQKRVIWVEPCEPVSVGEFIHAAYQAGVTRCVRAVGVDSDWGMLALNKFATAKNRKIERVVDGVNPSGLRVVEFRFSNIVDSSRFKVELQNDMEWEHCNIYYSADPCETNTGIHTGIH